MRRCSQAPWFMPFTRSIFQCLWWFFFWGGVVFSLVSKRVKAFVSVPLLSLWLFTSLLSPQILAALNKKLSVILPFNLLLLFLPEFFLVIIMLTLITLSRIFFQNWRLNLSLVSFQPSRYSLYYKSSSQHRQESLLSQLGRNIWVHKVGPTYNFFWKPNTHLECKCPENTSICGANEHMGPLEEMWS